MRSIRGKITAIAIAAILISMLIIMSVYFTMFQTESERQAAETMNLLARNTEKTLEKYIESIEQSVEMAANLAIDTLDSVILVENNAAGPHADPAARTAEQAAAADEYLTLHCKAIQEAFASVASRTNGVVTYYYYRLRGAAAPDRPGTGSGRHSAYHLVLYADPARQAFLGRTVCGTFPERNVDVFLSGADLQSRDADRCAGDGHPV